MASLYEYAVNAENKIDVDEKTVENVYVGTKVVNEKITALVREKHIKENRHVILGFDGYYCVDWEKILSSLETQIQEAGIELNRVHINEIFLSQEEIAAYKRPFLEHDPDLGWENQEGRLEEIMDAEKTEALVNRLAALKAQKTDTPAVTVVYAPGACVQKLFDLYDYTFYFDMTKDPVMWNLWDNTLIPVGHYTPDPNYYWKELYYVDFHLLDNQKWFMLDRMDFYVEAVDPSQATLIAGDAYNTIIHRLLDYPIKQVKIFMPGAWGAYRFKQLWEVPGLDNSAWNNISSPKLDMIVDLGEKRIRLPGINLLQHGDRFVGKYWDERVPKWWPLLAAIDDGYFEDPDTPMERTAMPQHNHPSTDYARRHFNEQFGRYETYYIVEAYEGSATMMGFKDDANLEEWQEKCRTAAENKELIPDWRDYVKIWSTAPGDLFLIPPGTTHGHGGRQMVLEMDTNVNSTTCEYSFFMHDYGRHTWNDAEQTMTGKKCNLQCRHGFSMDMARRESWVKDHLRARPQVVKWTPEYSVEQYTTLSAMPFHIERIHFTKRAEYSTEGRFLHVATLTVGTNITIRSKSDSQRQTTIDFLQAAAIPADFGDYELINNTEGACTLTLIRMKLG